MAVSKGDKVRIKRQESYWFNEVGSVVSVEATNKYGVMVRFEKTNYFGIKGTDNGNITNSFAESELERA